MSDYRGQVERLNNWLVPDILNAPALTLGMLRSAAASIERLCGEVDRLNHENFWLTKKQEPEVEQEGMTMLPPFKRGDMAWAIGGRGGNRYVQSGNVGLIEIIDGKIIVQVKYVGRGEYGKTVFATEEEAEAHL
jgi:hypothetical protein